MTIAMVAYVLFSAGLYPSAHIVFPGGEKGEEFVSKEEGRAEVDRLVAAGKLAADEGGYLRDCIRESALPDRKHPLLEALKMAMDLREEIEDIVNRDRLSEADGGERSPMYH